MRSVENFKVMNKYEASFIDGKSMKNKWVSSIYRYTKNGRLYATMSHDDVLCVRVATKRIERPWKYTTGSFYMSFE